MNTAAAHRTRPRGDSVLTERLARSAASSQEGLQLRTADVTDWLEQRRRAHRFRVDRIPFEQLDGWTFKADTGNLVHRSGRFFTVEGLHAETGEQPFPQWQQPIINQPEIGILGILVKEFDGVPHLLMQAKMEPGNPNLLQLSPTVQATRSNYTRVHRGGGVKYLEYFTRPGRGRVITSVLQSEHGAWFLRKANRNMLVETTDDVPADDDFCWLTLGQVGELLRHDNVVNMDARTVLACLPGVLLGQRALHPDAELLSWITSERFRHDVRTRRIPLDKVSGWRRGVWDIDRADGRYFTVVAVSVEAGSREVPGWSQPLIAPHGLGVTAFITRRFDGVPHLLVHARVEGGLFDTLELAPTVQYTPDNYAHLNGAARPPFLDFVLTAPAARIRYEAVHSEEGGRFLHAQSRYLFVDADEGQAPTTPPPGYRWVTPAQLSTLVQYPYTVNVQARTLLSCLTTDAARI